jgi:hypothetical protein
MIPRNLTAIGLEAMRLTVRGWRVWLVVVLVIVAWPATAVAQEPEFVVEGRAVNGSGNNAPEFGLLVTLHQETTAGHEDSETTTDVDGKFRFEGIENVVGGSYGVSVDYQGVMYGLDVDPSQQDVPIELVVYEAVDDDSAFDIEGASLLIVQADEPRTLWALEIITVANRSNTTYVPGTDPMKLLRFSLPPGARDLNVESSLPGEAVQVDLGFALTSEIQPGEYEVMFSYMLPYEGSDVVLPRSYPHGTQGLRVLALPEVGALESDAMGTSEPVLIGSDVYQIMVAEDLPAGSKFSVSLSGLTQPTFGDRVSRVWGKVKPEYAALGGLAVFMTSLLVFGVWKTSRPAEEDDEAEG